MSRVPIQVKIGRDLNAPDLHILAYPTGEPEKQWGRYSVLFTFASITQPGGRGGCLIEVENFPRALGTDGLALYLLRLWTEVSECSKNGVDKEQPGGYPAMPTDEEMAARPLKWKQCDMAVAYVMKEQP